MVHLCSFKKDNWESDFPIICEDCLGPSPFIKLQKSTFGDECRLCKKPFTLYRWKPQGLDRLRRTEICPLCAQTRNICQSCVLDLDFAIPQYLRDSILPTGSTSSAVLAGGAQISQVGMLYQTNQIEERITESQLGLMSDESAAANYGKAPSAATIISLARSLSNPQNSSIRTLRPPRDKSITSLYLGGLTGSAAAITERDIRDVFYPYGKIKYVKILPHQSCAFISYTNREGAELAASTLTSNVVVAGHKLKLMWAKPKKPQDQAASASSVAEGSTESNPSSIFYMAPMPGQEGAPQPLYLSTLPVVGTSSSRNNKSVPPRTDATPNIAAPTAESAPNAPQ